jgi:hypothetical protein
MNRLLRKWLIPFTALCVLAPHVLVRAGWYAENTEDGADIVSMELRYPRWAKGLYFSCWNMQLLPQGGSFYGGVQSRARSDRPEDQDRFRPPTTWSFWSDPDKYGGGDVLRNVFMHPEVYASLGGESGHTSAAQPEEGDRALKQGSDSY